jgi:hypothetical protein
MNDQRPHKWASVEILLDNMLLFQHKRSIGEEDKVPQWKVESWRKELEIRFKNLLKVAELSLEFARKMNDSFAFQKTVLEYLENIADSDWKVLEQID